MSFRWAKVLFAHVVACFVAAGLLPLFILFVTSADRLSVSVLSVRTLYAVLAGAGAVFLFTCPALIFIWASEKKRENRLFPYVLAGAGLGGFWGVVFSGSNHQPSLLLLVLITAVFSAAGAIAASVYWLVAFKVFGGFAERKSQ